MSPRYSLDDFNTVPDMSVGNSSMRFVPLEEFAAVDEPGADPLVSDLGRTGAVIPAGGLLLVYGDGGAGKTTLLIDLTLHLAAGIDWCGVLAPARPLQIAWIENEGPRPMMRVKVLRKLESWPGPAPDGRISVQDKPWAAFSFRDEDLRNDLAAWIDQLEIDLLVVGPLSRIGMEGGGTSDDIRNFLDLVEAARARCERPPAILIVHHENRAGQVSGAWEREPDSLIHIQGQGHGRTRVFWQKIRWCSALHATSTHLLWAEGESFTVEDKPEVNDDTIAADILAALLELPGSSWSKIRRRVTGNASEAARVRDQLLASGRIVNTAKRDGFFNLWNADDPATRSEPGTTLELLSISASNGTAYPSLSPFQT